MKKRLTIAYLDGTVEAVDYYGYVVVRDGVLTLDLSHDSSYNRRSRSWPLTSIRSWEDV